MCPRYDPTSGYLAVSQNRLKGTLNGNQNRCPTHPPSEWTIALSFLTKVMERVGVDRLDLGYP